jgi:hypothetical protein
VIIPIRIAGALLFASLAFDREPLRFRVPWPCFIVTSAIAAFAAMMPT